MKAQVWEMVAVGEPLRRSERDLVTGPDDVVVQVAGCGICHTDLGFLDDGVPTRHELPLVLGHEISGTVVEAGPGAEEWVGRDVVIPAVIPCGQCADCEAGRGSICRTQVFPGNDLDGGFASHVRVPARGLCEVGDLGTTGLGLGDISVVADAVTTPYQSILRSGLREGDLAIFVGVGGVGGFGVQIARAMGARVVGIDVDPERLSSIADHGAALILDAAELDGRMLKKAVRAFAKEHDLPGTGWKIFETSGTPAGQKTAFSMLVHGAYLGIVGYSPKKVEVPLSNLMAFDAVAQGNWGCLPEHYPGAVELIRSGQVAVAPFVERHPMSTVNAVLDAVRDHQIKKRVVLVPDFDA